MILSGQMYLRIKQMDTSLVSFLVYVIHACINTTNSSVFVKSFKQELLGKLLVLKFIIIFFIYSRK